MKSSAETVRDIISHLEYQLGISWQAFLVSKLIHKARNAGQINCSHYFFSSVEESCLERAILILGKIAILPTNPRDKSIHIHWLLNFSDQNTEAYLGADNNVIRDLVLQYKKELENFKPLLDNIKEQRDHTIAHLDRAHIKNPSAVYTFPPIDFIEVENFYAVLLNMVNAFSKYQIPSSELKLDNIEPGVIDQYLRQKKRE